MWGYERMMLKYLRWAMILMLFAALALGSCTCGKDPSTAPSDGSQTGNPDDTTQANEETTLIRGDGYSLIRDGKLILDDPQPGTGDVIKTDAGAEVTVTRGSRLFHLTSSTELQLGSSDAPEQYLLNAGKVLIAVPGPADDFAVITPVATAGVRGTSFSVSFDAATKKCRLVTFAGLPVLTMGERQSFIPPFSSCSIKEDGSIEIQTELGAGDLADFITLLELPEYSANPAAEGGAKSRAYLDAIEKGHLTRELVVGQSATAGKCDIVIDAVTDGSVELPPAVTIFSEHPAAAPATYPLVKFPVTLAPGIYSIQFEESHYPSIPATALAANDRLLIVLRYPTGDAAQRGEVRASTAVLDTFFTVNFLQSTSGPAHHVDFDFYAAGEHGEGKSVYYGSGLQRSVELPEGRYDLHYYWNGGEGWVNGLAVTVGGGAQYDVVTNSGNSYLRFMQSENRIPQHVDFDIYRAGDDENKVFWNNGSELEITLPAGKYDIHYYGQAIDGWEKGIEIRAGRSRDKDIITNTGTLELHFLQSEQGPAHHVDFDIYSPDDHEQSLLYDNGTEGELFLPAGTYDLYYYHQAVDGWETGMVLAAGQRLNRKVITNTGTLKLNFMQTRNGAPQHVDFGIYRAGETEKSILSNNGTEYETVLPAGIYDLHLVWEQSELWSRGVVIRAGEETEKTVVTNE